MARILIAEDEPHILRVMSMWLQRNGHSVVETKNGMEALEALERESVDMLISDVQMPRMDGIGLTRAVREERRLEIPIMILSSSCERTKIEEDLGPHKVHVYPKPFTPSRLVAKIESLLASVSV